MCLVEPLKETVPEGYTTELPAAIARQLFERSTDELDLKQAQKLYELLHKNVDHFAKDDHDLGKTNLVKHTCDKIKPY